MSAPASSIHPVRCLLAHCLMLLALSACSPAPQAAHPDEAAVRSFLERYFSTWSARDMEGYGACFHPSARITFMAGEGRVNTDTLTEFLAGQTLGHQRSPVPMTEVADSMEIHMDERAALARVAWTLTNGAERSTGIDHFSLIKTEQGWKIIHLLFYAD